MGFNRKARRANNAVTKKVASKVTNEALQKKYEEALKSAYLDGRTDAFDEAGTVFVLAMIKALRTEFDFGGKRVQKVIDAMDKVMEDVRSEGLTVEQMVEKFKAEGYTLEG